jgi:hypothetical protein
MMMSTENKEDEKLEHVNEQKSSKEQIQSGLDVLCAVIMMMRRGERARVRGEGEGERDDYDDEVIAVEAKSRTNDRKVVRKNE